MAGTERRAEVTWEGNLTQGSGKLTVGSGAVAELPITWASRVERSDGKTSPEELIAAAHSGCFAMALSHTLTVAATPPERLVVDATCTVEEVGGGLKITRMVLDVRGRVPGLDEAGFEEAVHTADQGCPVSNALRNNLAIQLQAHLVA